jgi:hypothetical protein
LFSLQSKGSFNKTRARLNKLSRLDVTAALERSGQEGVDALASATPIDSGETAGGWGYEVRRESDRVTIIWTNRHVVDGSPIAILLQYGHGTGTGGYVQGRDFINPAIRPVFDKIREDIRKVVTSQ